MDPLSVTASIITVIQLTGSVISTVYNYRKSVSDAPEDAVKIVQDLTGLSQVLENLLQLIEKDKATRTARLESLGALIKPAGPLDSCQKTLERLQIKLQPEKGWRAFKQSLTWPLKGEYVKKTLEEIATAKATLTLALTVDQTSLALETKESLDALAFSFDKFRLDERRKAALLRISPTDATTSHLRARKKRQKDSGEWFIQSEQYSTWSRKETSVLWVNGIPGCGKTILCSIVIDDILRNFQPGQPQIAVSFYYFNFQIKAEQQFNNLLRFITLQLSRQLPTLPSVIEELSWAGWLSEPKFSNETLMRIVKEISQEFRKVYVIIDAIDECDQSEELLQWIQDLGESNDSRLHLLVSSRQDHRFRLTLEPLSTSILDLNEKTFERDIQLYIQEQLNSDRRMRKWPSSVQDDIKKSLLANCGGLFRWVDCQVDALRKCLRVNDIKHVLDKPPKTLNETYDRILANIDEDYVEDAHKILQWLVFSPRPLSPKELNEILAFDRSNPENVVFHPDRRFSATDNVLVLCSSLVTVSEQRSTGPAVSYSESVEVRLAHNSVKDYLLSSDIKKGSLSTQFAMEATLAHFVMAESCLTYLLNFQSSLNEELLQEFPLAPYAVRFWIEHYWLSEAANRQILDRLALRLLTTKILYRNCCCLHNPDRPWRDIELKGDPEPLPLYYASLTGLSRLILPLVAKQGDPNESGIGHAHGNALTAASYRGDHDSIHALLSAGAKPNGGDYVGMYGTPIATAASQGHTTVIELLLKAGADVNKMGMDGEGASLYQAAVHSHSETVKMLLDAGADANAYAGMSGISFAIEIAARRGDTAIVCLLFPKVHDLAASRALNVIAETGHRELFEIVLRTERGRAMGLSPAALAGWDDIVQSMIEERSSGDEKIESSIAAAISEAAASGSLETAQVLYENMSETGNFQDKLNAAVLSGAIRGSSLVVKYFMDRGADARSEKCQRALFSAIMNGHTSTVQVLLAAGVDSRSSIKDRWSDEDKSCLWAAVDQGHVDIARLLLASGADPDTQCRDSSALTLAIQRADEELFDVLVEKGASTATPTVMSAHYDTLALPVHCAASAGSTHIFRKLLDAGLETDSALIPDGWTALFHAAKAGHEEILRILIQEHGANVHRRANKGTVAIHTAAYHNHPRCIEVFLDAGVDVDVRGRAGRTSLHWAVQEGSIDAVRVLLERGADIFVKEKDTYMTAVDVAKAKASRIAESQPVAWHWKNPRDDNYAPILQLLEDHAASLSKRVRRHSVVRRTVSSIIRRKDSRGMSPP